MSDSLEQNRLFRAGSQPLEQVVDEVVNLAEAIWYQGIARPKKNLSSLALQCLVKAFCGLCVFWRW